MQNNESFCNFAIYKVGYINYHRNKLTKEKNYNMNTFFNARDLGDITAALAEAQEVKRDRFAYQHLGKNKTLLMVFFNNSLRTRLSTQKAAMNLGMNVIVLDVNQCPHQLH